MFVVDPLLLYLLHSLCGDIDLQCNYQIYSVHCTVCVHGIMYVVVVGKIPAIKSDWLVVTSLER